MKRKLLSALTVLLLLSIVGYSVVHKVVPMKGKGRGVITSFTPGPNGVDITVVGDGEGTHLGKFTREEHLLLNPNTGTFTGTIAFTAADGSELFCDVAGAFTGPSTAAGTYTFTGGTGRFEDASGTAFFLATQLDPVNVTFEFAGTIDLH